MQIKLITIGSTKDTYLKEGIRDFEDRLKHYVSFEVVELQSIKGGLGLGKEELLRREEELLKSKLKGGEHLVLLDEAGKQYSSVDFSKWLGKKQLSGVRTLVFVVGGPFGFSETIYSMAAEQVSLSAMTFTHQMVRLIFTEQLYRGFTILKGEKYHHI